MTPKLKIYFERIICQDLFLGCNMVQHMKKSVNIMKGKKTHTIIPINEEKIFDTIKHMLMVKMPKKLGMEGNCLN